VSYREPVTAPQDPFAKRPQGQGSPAPSSAPAYGPPPQGFGQPPAYGPPGQGYGSPPGYGPAPGYGPGQGDGPPYGQQETSSRAIVALVLAIGSFVAFPLVLAIVAIVLAGGADREIAQSGGRLTGEGLARAAKIISWINIALCVLVVVVVVAALAVATTSSGT